MIHHISCHRKSQLKTCSRPELDVHVIQLSHPQRVVSLPKGYLSNNAFEFVDEAQPTLDGDPITIDQASDIIALVKKLELQPELLQLTICCDTGRRPSKTLAAFLKEKYPHIKIHQDITKDEINWNMYAMLSIAFYGLQKAIDTNRLSLTEKILKKTRKALQQSPLKTAEDIKLWFVNEF